VGWWLVMLMDEVSGLVVGHVDGRGEWVGGWSC